MMPDFEKYRRVMEATESDKLAAVPPRLLQEYYDYLCSVPHLIYQGNDLSQIVARRVENLRHEMQNRQHSESTGLGNKTLFWAKVGGVAAVIGTVVLIIS